MAQELILTQEQQLTQQQQQRLTAQQVMLVRMLEMPLAQFEQNVQTEMDENPALEAEREDLGEDAAISEDVNDSSSLNDTIGSNDDDEEAGVDIGASDVSEDADTDDRETLSDELDTVLNNMDRDDRMESFNYERSNNHDPDADQEERIYGNTESFYDNLHDQMREQSLTERQELIMEYLIGSLDSDGLMRKDLAMLSDEIAIHEYIDVTEDEIEHVLTILQSFDPAGIGAQSLQQCLLIQIFRKQPTPLTKLMHRVINEFFMEFSKCHWKKVMDRLGISEYTLDEVLTEIRKLNPRPGAALGETMGRNTQQITPDFIIDTDDNGNVSFTINKGKVPDLYVSQDFENMIDAYRQNPQSMTRRDKEALVYAQQKVSRAKSYIDAIRQRHHTMTMTMRVITQLQKAYIVSGDESDLRPMILKDIADRVGMDISTVSRVCSGKYAETPWGIIPLKDFFSDRYNTGNGEEISTREIKKALKELVASEPKGKPLSDIKLAAEMKKMGYPIARRTIAKYREQMGIPTSNMRK